MFAADTELDVLSGAPALLRADAHELPDALDVDGRERVLREYVELLVPAEEAAGVVAAHSEAGLSEVVCAEREELRLLRDFVGGQRAARNLYHGAEHVVYLDLLARHHFLRNLADILRLEFELLHESDERHHNLHLDLDGLLALHDVCGGLENRARLHSGDLRIAVAETAAAVAEHRVLLFQSLAPLGDDFGGDVHLFRQLRPRRALVREEFVERRVEQADGDRQAVHRPEYALEVLALVRQELVERLLPFGEVGGENHLAHRVDSVALKEHVLSAAETDALGAELNRHLSLRGSVRVGAHAELAVLVGPLHNSVEEAVGVALGGLHFSGEHADYLAGRGFDFAEENFAGGSVYGDVVALLDYHIADAHNALGIVHGDFACGANADFAHLARHERRVRAHPAAGSQNALGGYHAAQVFGRGFLAAENHLFALRIKKLRG